MTNKTNEPVRPATVPAEAVWNSREDEWELGKKNAAGNLIGEWKYWLAPNGHLCCHTFFEGDSGNDFTYTRFHPDGTISKTGTYKNGVAEGECIATRSNNPTTEYFNSKKAGKSIWSVITTFEGGKVVKEYYYDKEGNEVGRPYLSKAYKSERKDNEALNAFAKGREGETGREAVQRLEGFLKLLNDEKTNENYMPVFIFTKDDLEAEAEEKFGITLPPSYKRFIQECGSLTLGTKNYNHSSFIEITRLSDELTSIWEVDMSDFSERQQENLRNTFCFSMGDESLQMVWFYCFKLDTQNPETYEMKVVAFDQDEWEYLADDSNYICEGSGFDKHISKIVNEAISDIMDDF